MRASKTCSYGNKNNPRDSIKMAKREGNFREQSFEGFLLIGSRRGVQVFVGHTVVTFYSREQEATPAVYG